jgi:hypothetical protein
MKHMLRIVEIMWSVIAAVSAYELFNLWNVDRQKAYMFGAFMVLAVFMFFFRRRTRIRYQQRQEQNNQNEQ